MLNKVLEKYKINEVVNILCGHLLMNFALIRLMRTIWLKSA